MISDIYKKRISLFLLTTMVSNLFLPVVSYALTMGAAAPEYTSFEPIDATSLVNPATGSFTYNLPLIEVPGPEGGYPLSLFNHAGIGPDQESSWTGLGWNLNPGAINRVVNGVPDDYSGQESNVRDQWSGGTTYNGQVTIPLASAVTQTIAYSWDTYQGFGIDYLKMSVGPASLDSNGNLGLTVGGSSGMLSASASGAINVGTGKLSGGLSASARGLGFGVGASLTSANGFSTSTSNPYSSFTNSIGLSKPINNSFGKISTETSTVFDIGLASLDRTQYWMDQAQATPQYGILNAGKAVQHVGSITRIPNNYAFDKYTLPEITPSYSQPSVGLPEVAAGPSFPAYDVYNISGQGTGGSMQPYMLENFTLFDQKKENLSYYNTEGYNYTFTSASSISKTPSETRRLGFRLAGDFSNAHIVTNPLNATLTGSDVNYPINNTPNQLGYTPAGVTSEGYNSASLQLAGSNHVEYFTNREITSGSAAQRGFINAARAINRTTLQSYDIQDLIGGFTITKSDGITYHYALPVYTYDSHQYSINTKRGTLERDVYNVKPYAYTWLLTAVTGPDYVDQNNNGIVDDPDFGYWTGFAYGKWTDTYQFRHPDGENEYLTDVNGTKFHSEGRKQLYYLDAVYTRSHTALFVKSIKQDGLGIASLTKGGFGTVTEADGTVKVSTPTLKLDEIVLVRNETLKVSSSYNTAPASIDRLCGLSNTGINNANVATDGSQLLTAEDMALNNLPSTKVIKKISLSYDYSLCPETFNSLAVNYNSNPATVQSAKGGKLTLKAVQTFGQGNLSLIPPTRFEYDSTPLFTTFYVQNTQVSGIPNVVNLTFDDNNLKIGDIIKFSYLGVVYYAVLTKNTSTQAYDVTLLNGMVLPNTSASAGRISCQTTKNPPYVKKAYDSWNLFKSDYIDFTGGQYNNDISRITSEVSAKSVDAWSLRKIITPLGGSITVNYESGIYDQVGVKNPRILNITNKIGAYYGDDNTVANYTPYNNPFGFTYKEFTTANSDKMYYINPYNRNQKIGFLKLFLEEKNIKYLLQQNFKVGDYIPVHSSLSQYQSNLSLSTSYDGRHQYSSGSIQLVALGDDYLIVADPYEVFLRKDNTYNAVSYTDHYQSYIELPEAVRYGGIRVSSVAIEDASGQAWKTAYEYTGGVTSYEPLGYDGLIYGVPSGATGPQAAYYNAQFYKNSYQNLFLNLMSLATELPDPGIIYPIVRKKQFVGAQAVPSYEQYEFVTFTPDMVKPIETKSINNVSGQTFNSQTRTIRIENRSALLGQLKRFSLYDSNSNLLRESRNEFTTNADDFSGQGRFEQLFHDGRVIYPKDGQGNTLPAFNIGTISVKAQYPAILRSSTSVDYKTGIQTTSRTQGYDFLSGVPTKQLASDGYGNQFLTESVPAYRYYTGVTNRPSLNSKFSNIANRHMLTQPGTSYTYKVDGNGNKLGVVAAQAQTWDDNIDVKGTDTWNPEAVAKQSGIWRRAAEYAWLPTGSTSDGLTPPAASGSSNQFVPFDLQTGSPSTSWKLTQKPTLYSQYSVPLENIDINGNFSTQKLGNKSSQLFITGAPASYEELAYTGAEENLWPNGSFTGGVWPRYETWNTGAGYPYADVPGSGKVHTGTHSVAVPAGYNGMEYEPNVAKLDPNKAYRASVWTTSPQAGIYYVIGSKAVTVQGKAERSSSGWYLLTIDIPPIGNASYVRVGVWNGLSQTIYADDFRFQPANAQVNTYVYDQETGQLTDILDNNNLGTHYEYDAMGRLIKIYKESFQYGRQLVSEKRFNYARNQKFTVQATLNGNGQLASSLPGGLVNQLELGTEVRYTVAVSNACQEKFDITATNAIMVDGINITTNQRLSDGTFVRRLADGCILSNVRAPHRVTFSTSPTGFPVAGTKYYLGCEACANGGGYTGNMMYKIADGCGGLSPTGSGQYYTEYNSACVNSGNRTASTGNRPLPCSSAAQNQSYEKQLQAAELQAAGIRVTTKAEINKYSQVK